MNVRAPVLVLFVLVACKREPSSRPTPPPTQGTTVSTTNGSTTPPPAAAIDSPAPASDFRETARFLPQGTPFETWTQSGSVRTFTGQDLFQAIDGAGEKYMAYGFRQMARTDYRKPGTQQVVSVEIYDMGSALGAFGQYSMLLSDGRDPSTLESQAQTLGDGGFLGLNQLVFWKGQHLVQINFQDDTIDDEAALRPLARAVLPSIATRVAASVPTVAALVTPTTLPRDGLVWGGSTYLAQNVFGIERTGASWVGHYRSSDGTSRWRTAVFERSNATEAHATALLFRSGQATNIGGLGEEAFSATSSAGEFVVARKGSRVVVLASAGVEGLALPPRDARIATIRAVVATLP
jgi:hypothetical protein